MQWLANQINELGRNASDRGQSRFAGRCYGIAAWLAPDWSTPWFNRGLLAKAARDWPECRRLNLRAVDLDDMSQPALWNLGIAATALGDWPLARRAWSQYGVDIPPGDGPPDLNLGPVPIRVSPDSEAEVLWCHRIDPARAIVQNVPLPDCDRAFGDLLLHDGEPRGYRKHAGHEVPVFNELEVLAPSSFRTFQVRVIAPDAVAARALEAAAIPSQLAIEDWSALRILCAKCSEGIPHDHHDDDLRSASSTAWKPERLFGVAAHSESLAREPLQLWAAAGLGREFRQLECVFARD